MKPVLIIDNGTHELKAGLKNGDPIVIENSIIRENNNYAMSGNKNSAKRNMFTHNMITNLEVFEITMDIILESLNVSGIEDLILTVPPLFPKSFKNQILEVLFETYNFRKVQLGIDSVYSASYNNFLQHEERLVVSSSNSETHVLRLSRDKIFKKYVLPFGAMESKSVLAKILKSRGVNRKVSLIDNFRISLNYKRECSEILENCKNKKLDKSYDVDKIFSEQKELEKKNNKYVNLGRKPGIGIGNKSNKSKKKELSDSSELSEEIISSSEFDNSSNSDGSNSDGNSNSSNSSNNINSSNSNNLKKKSRIEESESITEDTITEDTITDNIANNTIDNNTDTTNNNNDTTNTNITNNTVIDNNITNNITTNDNSNKKNILYYGAIYREKTKIANFLKSLHKKSEDLLEIYAKRKDPLKYITGLKERFYYLKSQIQRQEILKRKVGDPKSFENHVKSKMDENEPLTHQEAKMKRKIEFLDIDFFIEAEEAMNKILEIEPDFNTVSFSTLGYLSGANMGLNLVNIDLIRVTECLFTPSIFSYKEKGLTEIFAEDPNQNIFLTGGFTKLNNFKERVEIEMRKNIYINKSINVVCAEDPILDSFKGADFLDCFPIIQRFQYEEGYFK